MKLCFDFIRDFSLKKCEKNPLIKAIETEIIGQKNLICLLTSTSLGIVTSGRWKVNSDVIFFLLFCWETLEIIFTCEKKNQQIDIDYVGTAAYFRLHQLLDAKKKRGSWNGSQYRDWNITFTSQKQRIWIEQDRIQRICMEKSSRLFSSIGVGYWHKTALGAKPNHQA